MVGLKSFIREVGVAYPFLSTRFFIEVLVAVTRRKRPRNIMDILFPQRMCASSSVMFFFFKFHCATVHVYGLMCDKGIFVL